MKFIRTISLIIVLLLSLATIVGNAQPVKKHGLLKVEGTKLVDKNGKPVILRGMSLGWHNLWPGFYNACAVKWLHDDWECTVVRADMEVELNDSGYFKNPASFAAKIKAVVDAAIKEGIYVIIDWHSRNIKLNKAKTFFTEMATLCWYQKIKKIYEKELVASVSVIDCRANAGAKI